MKCCELNVYAVSGTQVHLCSCYTGHWFAVVDKAIEVKCFVCNMMNCTTGKRIALHKDVEWEIEMELQISRKPLDAQYWETGNPELVQHEHKYLQK